MTQTKTRVIVAADGGGTGCRAAVGTLTQGILAEAKGGPGNVHSDFDGAIANLTGAVGQALAKAGLADTTHSQITAHFGVAGAHSETEMAQVADAMPYGQSTVTGDRATSVRGVLGEADGFVIALGTGTIIARQQALKMRTVGGWGFDLSDQASGAWLGRRLLQEAVLAEDEIRAHTDLTRRVLADKGGLIATLHFSAGARPGDFAPLAREVIEAATTGDAVARDLMTEGADYLTRGLDVLGFAAGDILSLAGGVGPHYAPYLPAHMTANLTPAKGTSLEGAFAMACAAAMEVPL